ncbi:DNA-directed DNA polymerase [Knufia obscura]|uniref:DNA-directed DNA polymerase n=1 Tax=Knufia obscura TaxID=1635080 RepID=A0ABR0R8H0_9EURO|nr:DNA-directed DNA polymerase [Knufia obscura]
MGVKRARPSDAFATAPSKRPKVDAGLAKIWENLANEDEEVRLHAAYDLVTKHCKLNDLENANAIAKRLFRGLCSSRKSARLGFYLALVGALSERGKPFGTTELTLLGIISLLEAQTTPEIGTSGQDERDHYFGRLLACKAVFETGLLANGGTGPESGWSRLFSIICSLMAQKPWLRGEGAATISSAIVQATTLPVYSSSDKTEAVSRAFKQLKEHKLARTIDGVGIWLYVQDNLLEAKLPHNVWASDNPLSIKELPMLKKALLDSRSPDDEDEVILGTSTWSQNLHDAWRLVLRRMGKSQPKGQVSLKEFWQTVVDDGLFSPSATPERKFTGFLVLTSALQEVNSSAVPALFSKNLMASMIQALKSPDAAYLQKVIHRVFSSFSTPVSEDNSAKAETIVEGLLVGSDFADFDTLTKTKIVSSLSDLVHLSESEGIGKRLISWLQRDPTNEKDPSKVAARRKNILNVLQRAICQSIRRLGSASSQSDEAESTDSDGTADVVKALLHIKQLAQKQDNLAMPYDDSTYTILNERIQQALETLLAVPNTLGQCIFLEAIASLKSQDFQADESVRDIVKAGWKHFNKLKPMALKHISPSRKSEAETRKVNQMTPQQGLALLLATLLYEAHGGDSESIELLEDANSMATDFLAENDESKVANHMIDMVMSFMSRSSKFHRRVGSLIFDAFASHMSREGLESLADILTTKEGREGQQELFENGDTDLDDEGSDDEEASSEDGPMDSDVEVVDGADGDIDSSKEESASSSDDGSSESGDEDDGDNDEELTKFESALAAALGTRKLNQDDLDDDEGSDDDESDAGSDMSDSQMMELDSKLAEVFKNQQTAASAQKMRKEEMRSAKENVVNLKNRAMDLVELFLRSQQARGTECVELLGALLQMASTTGTQQLANRATDIVKSYVQKAKGAKLPKVPSDKETREFIVHQLEEVHKVVVQKDVSNASIEAGGQLNVLLCKLLIEAGEKDVKQLVIKVSSEAGSRTDTMRKAMQDFWSRYDAWLSSTQQKGKEGLTPQKGVTRNGETKQQSASQTKSKSKKKKRAQTAA